VYHVDELKTNTALKIDVKYYLSQQIHPVIARLCSPLEDIDSKMIAEHLGLIIIILLFCTNLLGEYVIY
jgi:DNA polymerase alpha subunit A